MSVCVGCVCVCMCVHVCVRVRVRARAQTFVCERMQASAVWTLNTHQERRPGDDLLSCYLFDPCRVTNRYSEHEDLSCGGTILQRGGSSLLWLSFGLRKSVFCMCRILVHYSLFCHIFLHHPGALATSVRWTHTCTHVYAHTAHTRTHTLSHVHAHTTQSTGMQHSVQHNVRSTHTLTPI